MKFFKVIYFRGEVPQGKSYTFGAPDNEDYKSGDVVEVTGHRKAMVSGTATMEEAEAIGFEKLKMINGIWKESDEKG